MRFFLPIGAAVILWAQAAAACGPVRLGPVDHDGAPAWVALPGVETVQLSVRGQAIQVAGEGFDQNGLAAFRPAFPLATGVPYRVSGGDRSDCQVDFELPEPECTGNARVLAVRPGASEVPENALRFYIEFSEPMARGDFLNHLRLVDETTEQDLTGVFFDNIYELWSPDQRIITVLVDPGRVKTGLDAHRRMGRAFRAGHRYALNILPSWQTIQGCPLQGAYEHTFGVSPELRSRVNPDDWKLSRPAPHTTDALVVEFGRPVDWMAVKRAVSVLGPDGTEVSGRWSLESRGDRAQFVPRAPWPATLDHYQLAVAARFEDVAGNNAIASFDHLAGEVEQGALSRVLKRPLNPPNPIDRPQATDTLH